MLITFYGNTEDYFYDSFNDIGTPLTFTSTRIELEEVFTGFTSTLIGTGFGETATGFTGTITGIATWDASQNQVLTATNFSWGLQDFAEAATDFNDLGDFSGLSALFSEQNVTVDGSGSVTSMFFYFEDVTSRVTIIGTDFGDVLGGGNRGDTINAGSGADVVFGDGGYDLIRGQGGDDSLGGGGGNDTIDGGTGTDTVFYELAPRGIVADLGTGTATGEGTDRLLRIENLFGSTYGDTLRGDGGNNVLVGWDGWDHLIGRGGRDSIAGGTGSDLIDGGWGRDNLNGNQGHDRIYGRSGDDRIEGGQGNDTLTGGPGTDRFVFRNKIDANVVTDYAKGTDVLALDDALWGGGLTAQQVVFQYATDTGADILFDFGGGETILLEGVAWRGGLYLDIDII